MTLFHVQTESETHNPQWIAGATRWTQLTFTEDDPAHFDLDFWVEVMRRSQSNALCLSAGGYMAFYPTAIEHHYRSASLGDTDPFGDLVQAARSLGMHVMARVDPHAIHDEAARAHPEWLARDVEGNPIAHASEPGVWYTDEFSAYHREFITEVAREIVREYDVDAIFANRWEGHGGISYAHGTADLFRTDTGFELPRPDRPDPASSAAYSDWRGRKLSELVVLWDDAVREIRPDVRFIPNRGANLTRDLVPDLVRDRYPMFFIDKQGRSGVEASWTPGQIGKRSRGMFPDRPVALISSVGPEHGDLRWKDSVTNPHELLSYIVDGFAQGANPWFTKFKAQTFDERWVAPIAEAFGMHAVCEPVLDMPLTADVAVLNLEPSQRKEPNSPRFIGTGNEHEDGFYQAMVEARIPFEYIASEALSTQRLQEFKVLVLPSCPNLTAEQNATIEAFVASGGSVVAAFDSSLTSTEASTTDDGVASQDASVATRDLALADLFGVRLVSDVRGPVKNNYVQLTGAHPITDGYVGTSRIVGGTHLLGIETTDSEAVMEFVPDYPDLPMEEVYPRGGTPQPAVAVKEHESGGRTAYLAFNVGQTFWYALQSDHGELIASCVQWALGEGPQLVRAQGAGLIDLAVRHAPGRTAVTVVNLNNPMAMRGQNRTTDPLGPQTLHVRAPEGASNAQVELLFAKTTRTVDVVDGQVRVDIEAIESLEVAHLVWSA